MKPLSEQITDLIAPSLEPMNIEIVQVQVVDGAKRKTIQVLAENRETGRITLDECAKASRTISALLDVEDVIRGAYNLEVSSPGIDRPLVKAADFAKYVGFEVKVETALPVDGRRRFRGELIEASEDNVVVRVDGADHRLSIGNIQQAKPVLTEALIKAKSLEAKA